MNVTRHISMSEASRRSGFPRSDLEAAADNGELQTMRLNGKRYTTPEFLNEFSKDRFAASGPKEAA